MSDPKTKKRDAVGLWSAIKQAEVDDDYEEIAAMSDSEVDSYIRENGGDPEAMRARGAAFAETVRAKLERDAWHDDAHAKIGASRKQAEALRSKTKLPREVLLERLKTARKDPRFAAPVAALFREKSMEASSDEELQALLDQLAVLAKLHEN